jgi:DNA-directed RNA polymerase sigma subunit (sigma70/sigma32)
VKTTVKPSRDVLPRPEFLVSDRILKNFPDATDLDGDLDRKTQNARVLAVLDEVQAANTRCTAVRMKQIIVMRFGLDGQGERTLDQVAEFYGVTRERIRQIEAKILRDLRQPRVARKLRHIL